MVIKEVNVELTELTTAFTELLNIQKVNDAPQILLKALFSNKEYIFDKWLDKFPDLSADNLQPIFQYYMADRKEKMQDYTPKSLAKALCSIVEIENGGKVYDMCAGSGALTIQAWNINNDCTFICQELDERVIPFLIFNLAIRNITATVIHGNVLEEEQYKAYSLKKGEKYSEISEISTPVEISADICISNPPYNIKFVPPPFAALNERYRYGIPPNNNANYAFVLAAIQASKVCGLILPRAVLEQNNNAEQNIREELVNNNLIDSVVLAPCKMFESTDISTCVLSFRKGKSTATVSMVDMRKNYIEVEREQRGQFGGKSHENRVYEKTVNEFSDENISDIISAIQNREIKPELSAAPGIEEIRKNKYSLNPAKYIELKEYEAIHRDFSAIMTDINRVIAEKNSCKLVINETLAKTLGLDVALFKSDKDSFSPEQNEFYKKISGQSMLKPDYVQFTKNKGEFTFKANDPERLSTIFLAVFQMWKQHIMYLNEQENIFLAELRDALLPDLMSGKIEI